MPLRDCFHDEDEDARSPGSILRSVEHMTAAEKWARDLATWAIPDEVLAQATDSPWIHPPVLFDIPAHIAPSPSHDRAREALGGEASVLDIGCGGGIATFALVPDVQFGVGVDHQPAMLTMYQENGERRGVRTATVAGDWPDVAHAAPRCDVVAVHHVVYNVSAIVPFVAAAAAHARHRVVIELPTRHPLEPLSAAWQFFWHLDRPSDPTPTDLMAVLRSMGVTPQLEEWEGPMRTEVDLDQAAHFTRIRLCLPKEREPEVRAFLESSPPPERRSLATIWWDVA